MADLNDPYGNQLSLQELAAPESTVSFDNFSTSNEEIARSKRLEEAKQKKLDRLTKLNQGASLDNSFTELDDGTVESNSNKIWNDLSGQEYQSLLKYGLDNYTLTQDEQGNYVYGNGEAYSGPTRRLYMFGTNNGSGEVKFGLARGDLDGSEARYQDTGILGDYGWAPGEYGVNPEDKRMDVLLPNNVATMLEGLAHGRREALDARTVKDRYADPDLAEKYGSGSSEYYNSQEGLFGAPAEIDQAIGQELFSQYITDMQGRNPKGGMLNPEADIRRIMRENQEIEADRGGVLNRLGNTASGFAASFIDSLIISPIDAVGDLTGLYDFGDAEENTQSVNEFFGYNPVQAERAMENISKDWEVVSDKNATLAERMRAAGNGALEAFITPEMWGTSMGMLASWVTPGTVLKAVGVGSKFANTAKAIDAAADAGTITKAAARAQKAKAFMSIDGAKAALTAQSGFTVSAIGNVNKQYEEFVRNNNGVELGGSEKAKWFAGRFAVQMVNQNLDKLVDFSIIKNPGMIASAIPAVKAMTNKEFANVAKTMAKGVVVTGTNMGKEAVQEYSQTMMELFNSRYGSEKFKNVEEFTAFLVDERNTSEAGVAALAGAGGAPQFEAVGTILPAAGAIIGATGKGVGAVRETLTKETTQASRTYDPDSAEADKEVARAVQANVERMASSTSPTGKYYGAQGSGNAEARQQASAEAKETKESILNGTNSVFNSDEEFDAKLSKLDPLIEIVTAEDPNLTINEILEAVNKKLKPSTPEQEAQVEATVNKAHRNGLEFASIKPLLEVSKDVSTGVKGFVTYYTNAKAAQAEGDTKAYKENLEDLDYFYNHQNNKLNRIDSGVVQVRSTIEAGVDALVKQGKATTRQEALNQLVKKYVDEDTRITIKNSNLPNSKTTDIKYSDVAMNMVDDSYNEGIYWLSSNVRSEVAQMSKVYNSLLGKEQAVEPVAPVDIPPAAADVGDLGEAANGAEVEVTDIPVPRAAPIEDVIIPGADTTVSMEKDFGVPPEELDVPPASAYEDDFAAAAEESFDVPAADTDFTVDQGPDPIILKDSSVEAYNENRAALKENKRLISERRAQLRLMGMVGKDQLKDPTLVALLEQKQELDAYKEGFSNTLRQVVAGRIEKVKKFKDNAIKIYTSYKGGKVAVTTTLSKLFQELAPTGFTITGRTKGTANKTTKDFANNLLRALNVEDGDFDVNYGKSAEGNPLTFLMFDEEGKLNYNTVEAMQAAAYEFIVQEASNLRGTSRTDEEVGELLGIPEEFVTVEMSNALANGGITLKLAAAAVGEKVIKNLGLRIESTQEREAIATAFGMMTLQGLEGDMITNYAYVPTPEERNRKTNPMKGTSISFIMGTPSLFDRLKKVVRPTIKMFEDTLGVEIDKERTYRNEPTAKRRKVDIHRAEYQEAPKDHQDVVNRLENTGFEFNSGNEVMLEMFGDAEGNLDTKALVDLILGSSKGITNQDGKDRYEAQEEALQRSLMFFQEAKDDVKDKELFFNWFIAKNHRIHLDSNRINPQNDKHLARWLLTTSSSKQSISKKQVEALLNGEDAEFNTTMFAYAVVQAFDGAKGVPGIDKDNEAEILAAAKDILENKSDADLKQMAKESAHIGHAALAIANIRKYMDADDQFESDIVLEVDGLTNGFAFRSMQFPVQTEGSEFTPSMWLEKVGVITEDSDPKLFALDSMNGARTEGQEDVYISVGQGFNQAISGAKQNLDKTSAKWVGLFEKYNKLPDFSDSNSADVKKFIRNLMKSPVMIFNYAAGLGKIANGLVNDQIMGTGYLSGRGLIDLLTEKTDGKYTVDKDELQDVFGKDLGEKYHKARVALETTSMLDIRNPDILVLKSSLRKAISDLYTDPLTTTLENLFGKQTEINGTFTSAAQFMFDYFKEQYDLWLLQNPEATDENKMDFLKDMASIVPGVAGASSDDQLNKVTFLKNVLEPTNNSVLIKVSGKSLSTNTVSRSYGDPGVGPAVLTVLSLDSSVLAKTINEAYKKAGEGALPIHDAIVLGVGEHSTIKSYNRNFYTANRGYSISQEFVNAIENFENSVPDANLRSIQTITGNILKFRDMKKALLGINDEVQGARKELFTKNVKVGQLVGPEGTMEEFNISDAKNMSIQYLSKMSDYVIDEFSQRNIKKALGSDYEAAFAKVKEMLEGCK